MADRAWRARHMQKTSCAGAAQAAIADCSCLARLCKMVVQGPPPPTIVGARAACSEAGSWSFGALEGQGRKAVIGGQCGGWQVQGGAAAGLNARLAIIP